MAESYVQVENALVLKFARRWILPRHRVHCRTPNGELGTPNPEPRTRTENEEPRTENRSDACRAQAFQNDFRRCKLYRLTGFRDASRGGSVIGLP